jgi:hypothetical protein
LSYHRCGPSRGNADASPAYEKSTYYAGQWQARYERWVKGHHGRRLGSAPPELRPTLGNYPELGKAAAKAVPGAKLVEYPEL